MRPLACVHVHRSELEYCRLTDEDIASDLASCLDAAVRADIVTLSMNDNDLTTIPEGTFRDLPALRNL